jgi:hypothetical protein
MTREERKMLHITYDNAILPPNQLLMVKAAVSWEMANWSS